MQKYINSFSQTAHISIYGRYKSFNSWIRNVSSDKKSRRFIQKIIYEPKEEVQVIEEKEERKIKDFSNIKSFEGKKITSLQEQYGDFNFSKLEQTFEFHRYNAGGCRVFIQNYTSNKLIIHITIYDLETNSVYEKYEEEKCS